MTKYVYSSSPLQTVDGLTFYCEGDHPKRKSHAVAIVNGEYLCWPHFKTWKAKHPEAKEESQNENICD